MMALINSIQWALGLGILVVGGFMLFGRAEEAPSYDETVRAINPEDIPPPPADLPIKLVDAKTKACMADMACMQDFFLKVTLGNAYEKRPVENPTINKWRGGIRFKIYGLDQLDDTRYQALDEAVNEVRKFGEIVGLDIKTASKDINAIMLLSADLAIDLDGRFAAVTEKAFRPIPGYVDDLLALWHRTRICAGLLSSETDGRASYIGMYINSALTADQIKRCIYEEFTQTLGLYADVTDKIDSLYTDQAHRRQLTEFDFLLLRLLYHPLIEPGMSRDDVIQVFPDVYGQVITRLIAY